jgi:DNA-binding NarL/FixJ family response regulator
VIRVLVVDDSVPFLAAATDVVVASDGFDLDGVAATGEEGVELARLRRPDLALVDLNMPGIDGHETAARIATASPETAVVLMTAEPALLTKPSAMLDKRRLSPATLAEIRDRGITKSG